MQERALPDDLDDLLPDFSGADPMATRQASGKVLNALAERVPTLIGGSADLAPSNMTYLDGRNVFSKEARDVSNVHFGVREHCMAGPINGMALHR